VLVLVLLLLLRARRGRRLALAGRSELAGRPRRLVGRVQLLGHVGHG
jgi:hypothetical protein